MKRNKSRRNPAKFSKIVIVSVLAAVALFTVAMISCTPDAAESRIR